MYLFMLHNSQGGRIIICTANSGLSLGWNLSTLGHTLLTPQYESHGADLETHGTENAPSLYA